MAKIYSLVLVHVQASQSFQHIRELGDDVHTLKSLGTRLEKPYVNCAKNLWCSNIVWLL
jgi:hypothetical protein